MTFGQGTLPRAVEGRSAAIADVPLVDRDERLLAPEADASRSASIARYAAVCHASWILPCILANRWQFLSSQDEGEQAKVREDHARERPWPCPPSLLPRPLERQVRGQCENDRNRYPFHLYLLLWRLSGPLFREGAGYRKAVVVGVAVLKVHEILTGLPARVPENEAV